MDDAEVHGTFEYAYSVVVSYWMLVLAWKGRKGSPWYKQGTVIGFREVYFIVYVCSFVYSLHVLSNFFNSGSGYPTFKRLRAIAVLLDISFDYLNANEFPKMVINCGFANHKHKV